jgi:hypothetical protein
MYIEFIIIYLCKMKISYITFKLIRNLNTKNNYWIKFDIRLNFNT